MMSGAAIAWSGVRRLACLCVLAALALLYAAPAAALFSSPDDCRCGCPHANGKPCCCRRSAKAAGPAFERGGRCGSSCNVRGALSRRTAFLPVDATGLAPLPVQVATAPRAAAPGGRFQPPCTLRDRSPPA